VLKSWEGLGYYGRARHLHAAAQAVVEEHGGRLPDQLDELLRLKGIGRYTAGAIASIAFGQREPIVDGNITRVLARLLDLDQDVTAAGTRAHLWRVAADLVPAVRPGDFNQALMELGQVICLPASPRCGNCPLAALCLARQRGTQLDRPVRPARRKIPHYDVTAAVIWGPDGRLLIARRPLDGLLGGLWEFPGGKREAPESLPTGLAREIREELALEIVVGRALAPIAHAYTHFRITLHPFHAYWLAGRPQHLGVADHAWIRVADVESYAFAATDRQIIAQLRAERGEAG
jgi:A/G-specific adenine glycosylase